MKTHLINHKELGGGTQGGDDVVWGTVHRTPPLGTLQREQPGALWVNTVSSMYNALERSRLVPGQCGEMCICIFMNVMQISHPIQLVLTRLHGSEKWALLR